MGSALDAFTWVTGEPFSYRNWASSQPNAVSETALVLFPAGSATWGDALPTGSFAGVCETETWPTW